MGKKEKKEFIPRVYSESLMNDYNFNYDKYKTFRIYNPKTGLWILDAETIVEKVLRAKSLDADHISNYYVREVMSDLKALCFKNIQFPKPHWCLIPFNNGVYNLRTKEFSAFEPDHHLISKLAVNYNPDIQDCPLIDKVLGGLVIPEKRTELYELASYCMVSCYNIQEIYFLVGAGRNGKSIYTHIITRLLDKQNISAVSLHDLQTNRFANAELYGKYANISAELRYNDLTNTDQIKKLSGGDMIYAERKFQNPFGFENYAKLIFVTNELPRTDDKTHAFFRRARVIQFPNIFEGDKEDKLLKDKITDQELDGLAFRCVEILHEMISRNFTFTNQSSTEDIEQEYEALSNPITTFIEQKCIVDDDESYIPKEEFRQGLDCWLRSTSQRIRKDKEVSQYMKDRGIEGGKKSVGVKGRKNSWVGIKWKK